MRTPPTPHSLVSIHMEFRYKINMPTQRENHITPHGHRHTPHRHRHTPHKHRHTPHVSMHAPQYITHSATVNVSYLTEHMRMCVCTHTHSLLLCVRWGAILRSVWVGVQHTTTPGHTSGKHPTHSSRSHPSRNYSNPLLLTYFSLWFPHFW